MNSGHGIFISPLIHPIFRLNVPECYWDELKSFSLRYFWCYGTATVVLRWCSRFRRSRSCQFFSYYIMILGTGVKNASGRNNLIPFQTRWTKMTKFMVRKICQTCPPQRTLSLLRASANDSVQIQFVKTSICTICTSGKRIFILTVVYRHATFVSTYI